MEDLLDKALEFATKAHEGQLKYGAVAQIVSRISHSEEMLAAAYLHDVVEKCDVSFEQIEQQFGHTVQALVRGLTKPAAGTKTESFRLERRQLQKAPDTVKTIKLADIIDNVQTLKAQRPQSVPQFSQEKCELLEVLRDGDNALWEIAYTALGCKPASWS